MALSNTFLGILLTVTAIDFLTFYQRYRRVEPLAESAVQDLNELLVNLIFGCFFIFPETKFPVNFFSFARKPASAEAGGNPFDYSSSERHAEYARASAFALQGLRDLKPPTNLTDKWSLYQIGHVAQEVRRCDALERIEGCLKVYSPVLTPRAIRYLLDTREAIQGFLWAGQRGEMEASEFQEEASQWDDIDAERWIERMKPAAVGKLDHLKC